MGNALREINIIAKRLKKQQPRLLHTQAITQASAIYRAHKATKSHPVKRKKTAKKTHTVSISKNDLVQYIPREVVKMRVIKSTKVSGAGGGVGVGAIKTHVLNARKIIVDQIGKLESLRVLASNVDRRRLGKMIAERKLLLRRLNVDNLKK